MALDGPAHVASLAQTSARGTDQDEGFGGDRTAAAELGELRRVKKAYGQLKIEREPLKKVDSIRLGSRADSFALIRRQEQPLKGLMFRLRGVSANEHCGWSKLLARFHTKAVQAA